MVTKVKEVGKMVPLATCTACLVTCNMETDGKRESDDVGAGVATVKETK